MKKCKIWCFIVINLLLINNYAMNKEEELTTLDREFQTNLNRINDCIKSLKEPGFKAQAINIEQLIRNIGFHISLAELLETAHKKVLNIPNTDFTKIKESLVEQKSALEEMLKQQGCRDSEKISNI